MDAQPETPPNRRSGPRAGGPSDADPRSGQGSPLPEPLAGLKFDANGLIPAIVQDWKTGQVLMMAWMNRDSLARTVRTAKTHFFSRSRNKLWLKGESSGHVQHVKSLATDCDKDVLLVKVEQVGAACHEGYQSCFFRELDPGGIGQADEGDEGSASGGADEAAPGGRAGGDWKVVGTKLFDPEKVYRK